VHSELTAGALFGRPLLIAQSQSYIGVNPEFGKSSADASGKQQYLPISKRFLLYDIKGI
jgi:hypothetical protein